MRYPFITKQHKDKATHQLRSHHTAHTSKLNPYIPYNIMKELKRTYKITIFDALRILGQIDLLQEALKIKNNSRKRTSENNIILDNIDDVPWAPIVIRRPTPFYLSLRLEG